MKNKGLLLFLTVLTLGMYSCSNDDKDSIDIVGKWEFVKSYVEVEVTPADIKADIENDYLEEPTDYVETFEFFNNGACIKTVEFNDNTNDVDDEILYTLEGNKLTVTYDIYDEEVEDIAIYEVSVSGNTLTLKRNLLVDEDEMFWIAKDYPNAEVTKLTEVEVYTKK